MIENGLYNKVTVRLNCILICFVPVRYIKGLIPIRTGDITVCNFIFVFTTKKINKHINSFM